MKKCLFVKLLIVLFVFFYAAYYEPGRLILRTCDIKIEELPSFKIGIISDLHIGTKNVSLSKVKKSVNLINSQNPDIIFLLGDLDAVSITSSKIPPAEISAELAKLKAPYGVYSVLGNHDYEPENVVEPVLKKAGIAVLKNDNVYLNIKGVKVCLCGIKDLWHHYIYLDKILKNNQLPTILLSHNPDIFPDTPEFVRLTLSGHTHGGEIVLPIIGPLFVPSRYDKKYAKGYVFENNKHLFVTSGVASLSRARCLNPPEVVILNTKGRE